MSNSLEHVPLHNVPTANEVTRSECHPIDGQRPKGKQSERGDTGGVGMGLVKRGSRSRGWYAGDA
jgi:hypothetical protein